MGFRTAAICVSASLAALAVSPAWACAPSFFTPPLTLAERFAEGAWLAEAEVLGFEKRPSGFLHGDAAGTPMRRAAVKIDRALWGAPPERLTIRQWDEEFPNYWICMRYEPAFCPEAKTGDRLLILGAPGPEGKGESLECLTAEDAEKAQALRKLAEEAQTRVATLRAAAGQAAQGPEGYAAAMASAEALAEYGDHPATDAAFRLAISLDSARPEAWLRLARHRLEGGSGVHRIPAAPEDLEAGLAALDEYAALHGEHPRLRRLRDDLAMALGAPLDLARTDLRGASTALGTAGPVPLRGAPPGFDASRSRLPFDAVEADLTGANLREADLEGGDFSGAILRGAVLAQTQALSVSFRGADLRGADLAYARLTGADLSGADLRGASLVFADLRGADLKGADLTGAFAPGAQFFGARLAGARLDLRDPENPMIELAGAFSDCATLLPEGLGRGLIPLERLCGAEERIADLSGLETLDDSPESLLLLEDLDLRGANFSGAGLVGRIEARIAGADLGGADFSQARVYLFWGAKPRGRAKLAGAVFREAELVLNLPGADLSGADFTGAHVAGLKKGYDLTGAEFSGATLDFALPGYTDPADLAAVLEKSDLSGTRLACVASARPAERKLWAELAPRLSAAGVLLTPSCAEALAASAP
ncbi:pentapeptide repeat-containing protein [Neomegalonema sp.]|uniref:pentapeptide repeat-containing protein n=1 Tax=Neomegalonema sp. TaxID=2039713 RepID=UPI0026306821|nr:pentapeptide repeat-containing protein [Neomegalonema sp.]MDD2867661.1 pentapeptide repeat-containing protein [Neomegalonema sp.]